MQSPEGGLKIVLARSEQLSIETGRNVLGSALNYYDFFFFFLTRDKIDTGLSKQATRDAPVLHAKHPLCIKRPPEQDSRRF